MFSLHSYNSKTSRIVTTQEEKYSNYDNTINHYYNSASVEIVNGYQRKSARTFVFAPFIKSQSRSA